MPLPLARPCFKGRLRYSHHARRAANDDRYGAIELPEFLDSRFAMLIEAEAENGPNGPNSLVVKQVWRIRLDDRRDLVLAIQRDGLVRTVWINLKSDTHNTLNRKKYVAAPRSKI